MPGSSESDPIIEQYERLSPEKIIELKREEIVGRLKYMR